MFQWYELLFSGRVLDCTETRTFMYLLKSSNGLHVSKLREIRKEIGIYRSVKNAKVAKTVYLRCSGVVNLWTGTVNTRLNGGFYETFPTLNPIASHARFEWTVTVPSKHVILKETRKIESFSQVPLYTNYCIVSFARK